MIKLQAQSACRTWFAACKVSSVEDRSRDSLDVIAGPRGQEQGGTVFTVIAATRYRNPEERVWRRGRRTWL